MRAARLRRPFTLAEGPEKAHEVVVAMVRVDRIPQCPFIELCKVLACADKLGTGFDARCSLGCGRYGCRQGENCERSESHRFSSHEEEYQFLTLGGMPPSYLCVVFFWSAGAGLASLVVRALLRRRGCEAPRQHPSSAAGTESLLRHPAVEPFNFTGSLRLCVVMHLLLPVRNSC